MGGATRMTLTTTVMVMETTGALQLIVPIIMTVLHSKGALASMKQAQITGGRMLDGLAHRVGPVQSTAVIQFLFLCMTFTNQQNLLSGSKLQCNAWPGCLWLLSLPDCTVFDSFCIGGGMLVWNWNASPAYENACLCGHEQTSARSNSSQVVELTDCTVSALSAQVVGDWFGMGMDDTHIKMRGAPVLDEPALSPHSKMIADKLTVSELMSMAIVALPPVVRVRLSFFSSLFSKFFLGSC